MMVRGVRRLLGAAIAATACVALAAPAEAATVANGDFENGTLKGWSVQRATTFGNWFAYKGTSEPIASKRANQPIQSPPQGKYAAIADQLNEDTLILSQDVALEPGTTHFLSLLAFYTSYAPIAVPAPDTLSVDEAQLGEQANQQFRIDVIRPGAPLESLDPADVLATAFRTQPGAGEQMGTALRTADLSAFAGQTVRLRIAVTASKEVLAAGVDSVAITPRPPDPRSLDLNPRRFRLGKAKANPRNGTVTLSAEVPSPGQLSARSAAGKGAGASKAGKAPKLIRPARLKARAAGTVKLLLKPTAAALATLREKGRLRARVAVTFKEGVARATATKAVVFKLAPRR
jgi:hypothetical protein